MISYLARRIILALVTVVVAVVISFFLVHLTSGSPGQLILGQGASKAQIAAKNDELGWNQPLLTQLGDYLGHVAQGNLGTSYTDGSSVAGNLWSRLAVTGLLALVATIVSAIVGLLLALAAAVRGGAADRVVETTSGVALSLPAFWVGVILVYFLAVKTGIFPATGYVSPSQDFVGWVEHITLPVIALSIAGAAIIERTARVALIQALRQPYISMLRSMGVPPWRLLFLHALRSASIPVVSVLGLQFVGLFTGSIIIEALFGLPGLGQAASSAINNYDFPTLEGVVIIASLVVVVVNLMLDLVVAGLDPRVRTR